MRDNDQPLGSLPGDPEQLVPDRVAVLLDRAPRAGKEEMDRPAGHAAGPPLPRALDEVARHTPGAEAAHEDVAEAPCPPRDRRGDVERTPAGGLEPPLEFGGVHARPFSRTTQQQGDTQEGHFESHDTDLPEARTWLGLRRV